MDGRTGQVLYQQNGSVRSFPASTTKLLTALVAVERGKLDQVINVSSAAIDKGPDSATCSISEGDAEPLEYMLYGLLLRSGNDCADAIAEGVSGGNPQQFVAWMNETAVRVGATHSHFTNPHGLHDPDHYTTPLDLALIARAALENPVIRKIAGTQSFDWPGKERNGTYHNLLNDLLQAYPPLVAGKTGFTEEAGFTLAALGERDGRQLIGVTMGFESRSEEFTDMAELLDYGFNGFSQVEVVKAGTNLGEVQVIDGLEPGVPVMASSSFSVMAPKGGTQPRVELVPRLDAQVQAPVANGQQVGLLEIRDGEHLLGTVPAKTVGEVGVRATWQQKSRAQLLPVAKWGGAALAALFLVGRINRLIRRRRRRLRRATLTARERAMENQAVPSYRSHPPR